MDQSGLERLGKRIPPRIRAMIPRRITNWLRRVFPGVGQPSVREGPDSGRVVLYASSPDLFPDYTPRVNLSRWGKIFPGVTLVATVRNERRNVEAWLADLGGQERLPEEVVIVDAGSEDGTWEILQRYSSESPLRIDLVRQPGSSIARGRNLAIERANQPIIACTDFGCRLPPDWLANLAAPFEADPSTEVVAGWYTARPGDRWGKILVDSLIPKLSQIDPMTFLPSARSLAFRKEAWRKVGGFPEWLTQFGEDTFFVVQLKRVCRNWAFVPDAVVEWSPPSKLQEAWSKLVDWSSGDGESGIMDSAYAWRRRWLRTLAAACLGTFAIGMATYWLFPQLGPLVGIAVALVYVGVFAWMAFTRRQGLRRMLITLAGQLPREIGYRRGRRRRSKVYARRYAEVTGLAFILAGVPMDDTGGGSRGAQIASELLHREMMVIYLYGFPRQESVDLGIDLEHPHLLHLAAREFNPQIFGRDYAELLSQKPVFGLVEFPLRQYLDLAKVIKHWGGNVVYDLIDDWDTSLGGSWYEPVVERSLIDLSDLLTATAPVLADRLRQACGREALLLPNAVNLRLFDLHKDWGRPPDLPEGRPVLIYVGALWGDWFDWELLIFLAKSLPRAAVVVIGDYRGQCPSPPSNIHFLGLKPQSHLPGYLAHADVGILPWKVSRITQATSPLKIYEYLAMGKPVIAPRLDPLLRVPHVTLADTREDFLAKVRQAQPLHLEDEMLRVFLADNSWESRIDSLSHALAGIGGGKPGEPRDGR